MEAVGLDDFILPDIPLEDLIEVLNLQLPLPFLGDAEQYNFENQEILIGVEADDNDIGNEEMNDEEAEGNDIDNREMIDDDDDEDFSEFANLEIDENAEVFESSNEEMINRETEENDIANEEMIDKEADFFDKVDRLILEAIAENARATHVYDIKEGESNNMDTSRNEAAASVSHEDSEATDKFKDQRNSFVDHLFQAVRQIRIELASENAEFEFLTEDIQTPAYTCYFSLSHRYAIWKYIRTQKAYFNVLIDKYSKISKDCIFETCKEVFVDVYKPEAYSQKGFVNFCAAIAYLGIHCLDLNLDHNAETKVKGYIGFLLWDVLRKGPLDRSPS